jgi:dynein heavy chain
MSNIFQTRRFKWMVEVVQDSFNHILTGNTSVEDFIKMESNYALVNAFLHGQGPPKLIIYYQTDNSGGDYDQIRDLGSDPHLIFTTGEADKLAGKGVYFLRTTAGNKQVNCNDIDGDVIYGEIKDDTLKQLSTMISGVFLPLIRTMDNKSDWRECDEEQKKEFVNVTNKFSDELEEGIKSLSDSIETCKIDTNFVNNANEVGKSQYYEDIFEKWLNSFKEKLNDDQERNKKLTEGPRTELIHWKARLQDITLLSELTRSKDFMVVKNFLNNHSNRRGEDTVSKVLSEYKNIENQLTEKLNEAKDNVKYLTTLEKFIEPLYDGTPEEINDTLPALMNAIKMIHTIARYYNTSNKMTNLFIKITNQMITNCKNRITGKTDDF